MCEISGIFYLRLLIMNSDTHCCTHANKCFYPSFTVVATVDHVPTADSTNAGGGGLFPNFSPLSRSSLRFFLLPDIIDLKLCCLANSGGGECDRSGTSVKCTHAHQSTIVKAVKGIAMANSSQKFLAKVMRPLSFVCTNSVEKKFFCSCQYACDDSNSTAEILTATIVVGR